MVNSSGPLEPLHLSDVLNAAFPEAEGGGATSAVEWPVQVIPQGNEPRWVVIGDSRIATPVFRSWRPFKVSTRVRWTAVIAASSLGALSRLPGVITSRHLIDLSYWRRRLPGFENDWRPVLYIGNPSYTRKVTIFFVNGDRRFKAVAKVPLLDDSAQAILNEGDILKRLDGADYLPRCLLQDPQRGVAAQTWLDGDPVSRELKPAHLDLLGRFAIAEGTMRVSGQRGSIAAELDKGDLPFERDVLDRALEFLDYDQPLPVFIEHRDFAPWNLKRLPDGQTGAIDWEWAVLRSLPCQDIFRYFYIQDALFHGPGNVWKRLTSDPLVLAHYRRFGIPPDALPALAMHYQLRVLAMDWKGGNVRLAEYAFEQIKWLLKLERARAITV
jgi:hypothetical protein